MTSPDPLTGRRANASIPRGEVLGSFATYLEAQSLVDRLAKTDYPVAEVSILGRDLTTVERVTRRGSWNRAALEGAISGIWFGLFIGIVFFLFDTTPSFGLLVAPLLIGAAFGIFFRLGSYAISRRSRDFSSTREVLASTYEVLVPEGHLARAQQALAAGPSQS